MESVIDVAPGRNEARPRARRGLANVVVTDDDANPDKGKSSGVYTSQFSMFRQNKKQLVEKNVSKFLRDKDVDQVPPKSNFKGIPGRNPITEKIIHLSEDSDVVSLSPPPTAKHDHPVDVNSRMKDMLTNMQQISKTYMLEKANKTSSVNPTESEEDDDDEPECLDDSASPKTTRNLSVKINWQGTILKYDLQTTSKFSTVINWLAEMCKVEPKGILLFLRDRILKPDESPLSVGLTITDILDFSLGVENDGTQRDGLLVPQCKVDKDTIRIQMQTKECRSRTEIAIRKEDKMCKLMKEYADMCGRSVNHFVFKFDGDTVDPEDTAADLDLEDGCCIDVIEV